MIWICLCQALSPGLGGSSHWTRSIHQSHPAFILDILQCCVRPWVEIPILGRRNCIITIIFAYIAFLMGCIHVVTGQNLTLCRSNRHLCIWHSCLTGFLPLVVSKSMLAWLNTSQYIQVKILNFDLFWLFFLLLNISTIACWNPNPSWTPNFPLIKSTNYKVITSRKIPICKIHTICDICENHTFSQ